MPKRRPRNSQTPKEQLTSEQEAEKQRCLRRNRDAAAKCRQKKKDYSRNLLQAASQLEVENTIKRNQIQQMLPQLQLFTAKVIEAPHIDEACKNLAMARSQRLQHLIHTSMHPNGPAAMDRPRMSVENLNNYQDPRDDLHSFRRSADPSSNRMFRSGRISAIPLHEPRPMDDGTLSMGLTGVAHAPIPINSNVSSAYGVRQPPASAQQDMNPVFGVHSPAQATLSKPSPVYGVNHPLVPMNLAMASVYGSVYNEPLIADSSFSMLADGRSPVIEPSLDLWSNQDPPLFTDDQTTFDPGFWQMEMQPAAEFPVAGPAFGEFDMSQPFGGHSMYTAPQNDAT